MALPSTEHIAYLERAYLDALKGRVEPGDDGLRVPTHVCFRRVLGISRFWQPFEEAHVASTRWLVEDVLAGLHGAGVPLAFLIVGSEPSTRIYVGTTGSSEGDSMKEASRSRDRLALIESALVAAFPGIEFADSQPGDPSEALASLPETALVVGTPTVKHGTERIGVQQLERLIRGMQGAAWAYACLATPISETETRGNFERALNELRISEDAQSSASSRSPIARTYQDLLDVLLQRLELGKRIGMWSVSSHCFAVDSQLLDRAAALLKSVLAGEDSAPDPVRVLQCSHVQPGLAQLGEFTSSPPPAPGLFEYPRKLQSLLNSRELSGLVHLPAEEYPGYFVKDHARFDVATHRAPPDADSISIGSILDRGRVLSSDYRLPLKALDKHGMIVGTTGSGKTNTVFHLLDQLWERRVPFLVIEPAKTEYRKLLQGRMGPDLQVFSLGDEDVSPFRLNPFEILPGVSVQTHVDHLKSAFNASFIMYAPMPYVLERCIHELYRDRGWDLVSGTNWRGDHPNSHPTLTDLYEKIEPVVRRLGYEPKITMDVMAALKTRVHSLRIGGKGLMLDVRRSIDIQDLLSKPTVLELQQIGDDDEKSFIIGLILARLYEHRAAAGLQEGVGLSHVTVVEEAHRLFEHVPPLLDTEVANAKGKAVETFCNILSEVRAYGEGFLVAEQIPGKLAADIVKNTSLKVMHRVVAEDDRRLVGATMNLDDEQSRRIVALRPGQAAVFSDGEDGPILLQVPYCKIADGDLVREDEEERVRDSTARLRAEGGAFVRFDGCHDFCRRPCELGEVARRVGEEPEVQELVSRCVLSLLATDEAIGEETRGLVQSVHKFAPASRDPSAVVRCALVHAVERRFERRGQEMGWAFSGTDEAKGLLLSALDAQLVAGKPGPEASAAQKGEALRDFRSRYLDLCRIDQTPFEGCLDVCPERVCRCRYDVAELARDKRLHDNFSNTIVNYASEEMWKRLGDICGIAVRRGISKLAPEGEKRRIAACFAIQKSEAMPYMDAFLRRKIVKNLLALFDDRYGHGGDQ